MMRPALLAALIAVLPACSHSPKPEAASAPASTPQAISAVPDAGLPPQRLAPGKCGLFLWGMSAPRQFVFFAESPATSGLVLLDGGPVRLPVTSSGGEVFGQFVSELELEEAATGRVVEITLKPGENLDGGQRVDSGNITIRDAEGWETILPVTGVRACMPG
jgi:hypothetical protein